MIDELRSLNNEQQRRLVGLLEPELDLSAADEAEVSALLVSVLRERLLVPPNKPERREDLGEYLRRRLVEAVRDDFKLAEDLDFVTDTEIAALLIDYVIDAAAQMARRKEYRAEFETFLKTKGRRKRSQWLIQAERFAALATDASFDRAEAEERAAALGLSGTARQLLGDVAKTGGAAAAGGAAAGAASSAVARTAATSAAVALGSTVAAPLAVVAGGMYMAGLGKRKLDRIAQEEAALRRSQRARRSSLVQAVVTVSAFVLAEAELGAMSTPPE